jgi:hypothetical protein
LIPRTEASPPKYWIRIHRFSAVIYSGRPSPVRPKHPDQRLPRGDDGRKRVPSQLLGSR